MLKYFNAPEVILYEIIRIVRRKAVEIPEIAICYTGT